MDAGKVAILNIIKHSSKTDEDMAMSMYFKEEEAEVIQNDIGVTLSCKFSEESLDTLIKSLKKLKES